MIKLHFTSKSMMEKWVDYFMGVERFPVQIFQGFYFILERERYCVILCIVLVNQTLGIFASASRLASRKPILFTVNHVLGIFSSAPCRSQTCPVPVNHILGIFASASRRRLLPVRKPVLFPVNHILGVFASAIYLLVKHLLFNALEEVRQSKGTKLIIKTLCQRGTDDRTPARESQCDFSRTIREYANLPGSVNPVPRLPGRFAYSQKQQRKVKCWWQIISPLIRVIQTFF